MGVIPITTRKRKDSITRVPESLKVEDFFVAVMGSVGLASAMAWVAFGASKRTEISDQLTFIFAGLGALFFGIYSLKRVLDPTIRGLLSFIGVMTILFGIGVVEHKEMSREHPMGFGIWVLILSIGLIPVSLWIIRNKGERKIFNRIIWVPALFVVFSVSIAFWQTRVTLIESGHSEYVINEIWGPSAGYNTYQEFIPQYVYLIGWIIKPVLSTLGAVSGTNFLVLLLTFFGFAALSMMVWLAHKAWPELPLPILLLAILPFCTPTSGWNRISYIGPASTLLSGPALRVLGIMLIGAITVVVAQKILNLTARLWEVLIPGIFSSIIIWNNLDFGLAAMVASFLTISTAGFIATDKRYKRSIFLHLFGQLCGHLVVITYLSLQGAIPNWNLFGWFARQFGGGFGSVLISMPGPVNMAFPLMMGSAATGLYYLIRLRQFDNSDINKNLNSRSAITALYFGSASTFALPYYVNRSYHAGQMSILYLSLGVALIASVGLTSRSMSIFSNKKFITSLFPSLILSFMMATALLIPNPSIELSRLRGESSNSIFPRPPLEEAIKLIPVAQDYAKSQGLSLGFYGEGGNYVHVLSGIKSVNIFNSPLDMFQSEASIQLACRNLLDSKAQLLLMTESARQTFAWEDGSLCGGLYIQEQIPNLGVLGVRKR